LAAILERKRLGIAIAAMIKKGIRATPKYPKISPAIAMPFPFRRPALRFISEYDRWPKTMASIEAGRKMKKKPRMRLAIALPLVSG
jgi:hypothetical protein